MTSAPVPPSADATAEPVEVDTFAGRVRGIWRDGSAAFLGIPFAAPPVGDLRFAAPVPHPPWSGVRPAVEYGATPQRVPFAAVTAIPEPSIPGDSTLNVNVFTPDPTASGHGLPVLVWIHGGGFVAGSPASPWYDGASFNRDGVVTVSVSYRLGFDGFGWIEDAPINRGVLDWILALEWVRDNIARFGGDPSRVTIAGQSAGGGAVLTLLGVPSAAHLFQAAISISGATSDVPLATAEAAGRDLADLAGVAPTRAGLGTLTELEVIDAQGRLATLDLDPTNPFSGLVAMVDGGLKFGPVIDGDLIPLASADAEATGLGADKPLILGTTDNEFNMALAGAREQLAAVPAAAVLTMFGSDPEVVAEYVAAHSDLDTATVVGQYVTDRMFRSRALATALRRAETGAATWLYRFAWPSGVSADSGHCLDVPFWFDCLARDGVTAIAGPTPPQPLADDVHSAAVSFVVTGDPGWPAFDDGERDVQVWAAESHVQNDGYRDVKVLLGR